MSPPPSGQSRAIRVAAWGLDLVETVSHKSHTVAFQKPPTGQRSERTADGHPGKCVPAFVVAELAVGDQGDREMKLPTFSGHSSWINSTCARACSLGSGSRSRYRPSTRTRLRRCFRATGAAVGVTGWGTNCAISERLNKRAAQQNLCGLTTAHAISARLKTRVVREQDAGRANAISAHDGTRP